ncbi:MAG TPA: hypothetical protein VFB20_13265 [Burkholderiales bacterium]|nr:hypothetical protein [Burkholderiales bacterium]
MGARRIDDKQIEGLDLRSWRMAFNGVEAVSANTISAFAQRFGGYGFSPTAMVPVYGLAECCVGLAFPPPGCGPIIDSIDRDVLMRVGEPPDDVVLAPPHSVPKTSSGKLRRRASLDLYRQGDIGRPPPSPAWQAVRFAIASALPLLRRASGLCSG